MPPFSTLRIAANTDNTPVAGLPLNCPDKSSAINDDTPRQIRAAVPWRDGGKPIAKGDEARPWMREMGGTRYGKET